MPIKFRCTHCQQFLGISRSKAGSVTDCPSCGRTIRIPDLDGSVKPLPKPKLNLEDAGLSNALSALAGIDNPQRVSADAPRSAAAPKQVAVEKPAPVAVAEPRVVEPRPAPIPIDVEPSASERKPAPARPAEEVIFEVGELTRRRSAKSRPTRSVPVTFVVSASLCVLFFGLGFVAGRLTIKAPAAQPAQAAESVPEVPATPAAAPVEPLDGWTAALTGRITYTPMSGTPRPDEGARIIVMPEQRSGTVALPVAGFRAGAEEADRQLARSSLRALGGDCAVADTDGNYSIQLPSAGNYHVLIVSRHQPREGDTFVDPRLQAVLTAYFDRPAALVGPVAYEFSDFRFQGEEPSPRDHAFAAQ